ncbi:TylF/MycF/NovP-related O-methyltransferase [Parapedobacter koreensis]|uniref:Asparagine synthase (Glutamine-hydrolysing) n=1 Tax=Parapedobacter koreensis TaxID=332977 RepID=A0A1H7Q8G0_9SPHI|nr:TylF/MycF/NovP-related O-methyltransferase [Parapedobacter koreensis]SEL43944.1 asparagine synthase (glutamine-hydrolysing) [Parapedobacter koreensis]
MIAEQLLTKAQSLLYSFVDKEKAALMRIKTQHLTYLATSDLFNLYDTAAEVERAQIAGLFIETGCALGGSAIAIAKAKSKQREFRVYDAFGLIPPPSEKDDADVHMRYEEIKTGKSKGLGNNPYYGYTENLKDVVTANLAKHGVPIEANNIKLIKGYFEDTLYLTEPIAFAHIDCDWYASVMSCLMQIEPRLSPNGVLVFDDYYAWSGCRSAVDEYFSDKAGYTFIKKGRKLHVKKTAS